MAFTIKLCGENWLLFAAQPLPPRDVEKLESFLEGRGWAAVELRCLPLDTPRHFDPVELTGDAVGGPAAAVKAAALEAVGGLDPLLSPEGALLDLSVRLTAAGWVLGYCPFVSVQAPPAGDDARAYGARLRDRLLLSRRYGTAAQSKAALTAYLAETKAPTRHYPGVRKTLVKMLPAALAAYARERRCTAAALEDVLKDRTFRGSFPLVPFHGEPLVSIVVRTCGRPQMLCRTLACLRNQTYRHFEVVVVEDGAPNSRGAIEAQCGDLPIRYHATGEKVGRGRAGNIGIERARGEFVCFLDDDDYLYPEYLELSLSAFLNGGEKDLVLSSSIAFDVEVHSLDPYRYTVHAMTPVIFDHLDLLDMCVKCRIPVLGAMFRRELYTLHGGMREDIDGDEDWAMWLRYWRTARRADDTRPDIPRAICLFGNPADKEAAARRMAAYEVYDDIMLSDPELRYTLTKEKVQALARRLQGDIAHLQAMGCLTEFLAANARPEKAAWPVLETPEVTLTAAQLNSLYHALLQAAGQALADGKIAQWCAGLPEELA